MKAKTLLKQSARLYEDNRLSVAPGLDVFVEGARWMEHWLQRLDPEFRASTLSSKTLRCYGIFKYGVCICVAGAAGYLLFVFNPILFPLAILVFYLAEVHFLFLFPIFLNGDTHPITCSIYLTYRMGLWNTTLTVMSIAFFMLRGLLAGKDRYKNWHIGCLAILIWYNHEAFRNRV